MLNKIFLFFKKDAIQGELTYNTRKIFFLIVIIVFCILFFFKPFLLNLLNIKTQLIISIGCSILAGMGYIIAITIFMPFSKNKWTVFMEFATVMTTFFFAWLLIYSYLMLCFTFDLPEPFGINELIIIPQKFFYKTIVYTLGTGSFVYLILHMYNIIKFKDVGKTIEINTNNNILNNNKNQKKLKLSGKNKDEHLIINRDNFICAKSEGHYIKVYYLCHKSQRLINYVLRNTMNNLEYDTINHNTIYRCHKSFFINIDYLKSIIGNSNKSHAYIQHYPNKIPISKHKIKYLKDVLQKNS